MANETVLNQFFTLLEETIDKLGIKDMADRVYNCDESRFSLDPKEENVLAPNGSKHVYSQQSGGHYHVTVHCCICANGESLPPMIIFKKCYPSGSYTRGGIPNTLHAKSPRLYG